MPPFTFFSILLLFMAGICLLIALGQFFLAKTGIKKYFWAIAYFLVGCLMVYGAFVHSRLLTDFPHLYGPHIFLSFFPALGFFLYFRLWLYADESLNLRYHLLPGLTALAVTLPFMLSDAAVKRDAIRSYYENGVLSWLDYLFLVGLMSNVVYASWLAYEARILFRNIHVYGRSIFALTALCAVLSSVSLLIVISAYLLGDRGFERYGLIGLMIAACCGYFFMQRAAHLSAEMQASIAQERYRKSRLAGVDINLIREKLTRVMQHEKIFRDYELTMPKLAEKVSLTPHQLSEYLNLHTGKKFNEFMNEYRIAEACRLLSDPGEPNIMRIGMAAGFNSKSAFNLTFRKYQGMSPTEFRERKLTGSQD